MPHVLIQYNVYLFRISDHRNRRTEVFWTMNQSSCRRRYRGHPRVGLGCLRVLRDYHRPESAMQCSGTIRSLA